MKYLLVNISELSILSLYGVMWTIFCELSRPVNNYGRHRLMRNADVPTGQKLQFFCPFVSRSLRSSDILVLVTTKFLSMTKSMKGTPHQHCKWPIYKTLQLVWLIFHRDFSIHKNLEIMSFYLNRRLSTEALRVYSNCHLSY